MHGRNRGPEVVTGQLLTSTNSEPPVHFQTLEKGYPEAGTITVIADTDTHLEGWLGDTELMAWKPDLDQRILDAGKGGVYEQTYRG